jgi:DnaJ-class molecular chaperone
MITNQTSIIGDENILYRKECRECHGTGEVKRKGNYNECRCCNNYHLWQVCRRCHGKGHE